MPGCADIIKKLRSYPVKETATNMVVDGALNAGLGCLASVMGAGALGYNRTTAAQIGAAGNVVFGVTRSLIASTYHHFTATEETDSLEGKLLQPPAKQEQPADQGIRHSVSVYFSKFTKKKEYLELDQAFATEQKPEPVATPIDYVATAKSVAVELIAKPISYSILGNMLGYAMLSMPSELSLAGAVATAATGSALLVAIPIAIVAISLCAPFCADKCVDASDKCMDMVCCDGDDIESQRPALRR